MLLFLQQNAEWMCAIAIVIFTIVQCLISYAQYKQELHLKRFNLAQKWMKLVLYINLIKKVSKELLIGLIKIDRSLCIY